MAGSRVKIFEVIDDEIFGAVELKGWISNWNPCKWDKYGKYRIDGESSSLDIDVKTLEI